MNNCTAKFNISILFFGVMLLMGFKAFCQTPIQKKRIFKGVLNFTNQRENVSLIDFGVNGTTWEDFLKNSNILPYYKYIISTNTWVNDTSCYAVVYKDHLFYYNSKNIYPVSLDFNKASFEIGNDLLTKGRWKVGFLFKTESSPLSSGNPFFYDNKSHLIRYNRKTFNDFTMLIHHVFGSTDKYKALNDLDEKRQKITVAKAKEAVFLDYKMYENKFGQDTGLVISKFIEQINSSLQGKLGVQQKELLLKIITAKFSLFNNLMATLPDGINKQNLRSAKTNKSTDFFIYGEYVYAEVSSILTRTQLISYLDYLDTYYPIRYDRNGAIRGRFDYAPIILNNNSR